MGLFPKQMFEGTNWRKKHGEPQNASQLFQCVFTDQLFSLIPVNLLYLVFYLPAIAWTAICLIQLVSAAQATDASLVLATINTYTLGLIPCITLIGPFRGGMALLMRNWAREDYTKVFATFFKGVKENWKQMLLPYFLMSLLPMALWSAYQMSVGGSYILLIVVAVAAVLYSLILQVYPVLVVTYELKMRHHFRNAVLLFLLRPVWFVGVFIGTVFVLGVGIAFFVMNPNGSYINLMLPLVYYTCIGLVTTELACASLANKVCDTYFKREKEEA